MSFRVPFSAGSRISPHPTPPLPPPHPVPPGPPRCLWVAGRCRGRVGGVAHGEAPAQTVHSGKRRPPSRMVPPSPQSPLSPRFIAVFNSSRVAPSGADGAARPGQRGPLRLRLARTALPGSGRLTALPDCSVPTGLGAEICARCFDLGCALPSLN